MTKHALFSVFFLLVFAPVCLAGQSPVGEWEVKDKTAHIRIVTCKQALWGVISWAKTPGLDENNPDISKRNRSVVGIPILLGMAAEDAGNWSGDIYNADNGKTYHGNIRLTAPDILHVKGCVLGGFICGGEDWSRLGTTTGGDSAARICARIAR